MSLLTHSNFIRSVLWRLGRRLYSTARRETLQTSDFTSENWLMEQVSSKSKSKICTLMDVGTHLGYWTEHAIKLLENSNQSGQVISFEPTASTFQYLSEKFAKNKLVFLQKIALSNQTGESDFYVFDALAGINSLVGGYGTKKETVITMKLDDFLNQHKLSHIDFIKTDTEGHDLKVLMGAEDTLKNGKVDVWQFEYNHRWIEQGAFLKDVFKFISDKPYLIGKLYENGIETYREWHFELERFFEANYVLVRKGSEYEKLCKPMYFNYQNILVIDEKVF